MRMAQSLHDSRDDSRDNPREDPRHRAVPAIEDLGRAIAEDRKLVPRADGSNDAGHHFLLLRERQYVVKCGPLLGTSPRQVLCERAPDRLAA